MINLDYTEHAVQEVRIVNDDLFELVVAKHGLEFMPGDCVAIYTEDGRSRPYSIASGSNDDRLGFVVRKMAGGEVSPWLMTRRSGDLVRISPPFGWFRPGQEPDGAPFVFLATGTGIAPFLSYIRTFGTPPAYCLYGVRRKADAIGYEEMRRQCPTRLAVSREPADGHHRGRITDLLHQLPLAAGMHYYCCGLESMVNDVTAWLQQNGIELPYIHREVFFHG